MSTASQPEMTPDQYLAFERSADWKHEYVNGRVYAMSGAREAHILIVSNIVASLHAQFRGRPCRVYSNDLRVKISETGMYAYPDVIALCGEPRFEDEEFDTLLNPGVIVEVLSPSTEAYDRNEKFEHYRERRSLNEYLLIAADRASVDHYVKRGRHWVLDTFTRLGETITLPSVDATLRMQDVYERVAPFDSPAAPRHVRRIKEGVA